MLLSGMSPLILSTILGHTSTQMIEKHYSTIMIKDKIAAVRDTQNHQKMKDEVKSKLEEERKLAVTMEKWFIKK